MAKVLIVDDSPTEMHKLSTMLTKSGHSVLSAESGELGIEIARQEQPDVVLMDIVMPGLNGFQATRQLTRGRADQPYSGDYRHHQRPADRPRLGRPTGCAGLPGQAGQRKEPDAGDQRSGGLTVSMRASSAFQTLVALDTYCRQSDKRLPAQEQVVPTVSVVCFSLQGRQFAVPFSDIVELLEVPVCTRLPRVQSWVRGVANVRGRLLPIIDLAAFVGASLTTAPKQQRVLVMDAHGILPACWWMKCSVCATSRSTLLSTMWRRGEAWPPTWRVVTGMAIRYGVCFARCAWSAMCGFERYRLTAQQSEQAGQKQ